MKRGVAWISQRGVKVLDFTRKNWYYSRVNSSWNVLYTFTGKEKDVEIKLLDTNGIKLMSRRFISKISVKFVPVLSTKTYENQFNEKQNYYLSIG